MTLAARRSWIRVRRYAWAIGVDLLIVGVIVAIGRWVWL